VSEDIEIRLTRSKVMLLTRPDLWAPFNVTVLIKSARHCHHCGITPSSAFTAHFIAYASDGTRYEQTHAWNEADAEVLVQAAKDRLADKEFLDTFIAEARRTDAE